MEADDEALLQAEAALPEEGVDWDVDSESSSDDDFVPPPPAAHDYEAGRSGTTHEPPEGEPTVIVSEAQVTQPSS